MAVLLLLVASGAAGSVSVRIPLPLAVENEKKNLMIGLDKKGHRKFGRLFWVRLFGCR